MSVLVENQTEYIGLQDRVLARVRERTGETPRDIASYLEAEYDSVTRALSRLRAAGHVASIDAHYSPVFDSFDQLVQSAFRLEQARFKQIPAWRRVWRRLGRLAGAPWLGLPVATYFLAALGGYGAGLWLG